MGYMKQHLATIAGVDIYPIISLCIFLVFFLALGLYVIFADKKYVNHMKNRPLDDGQPESVTPKI